MYKAVYLIFISVMVASGCGKYSKGDRFTANFEEDSLLYVVAAKGEGTKISELASRMKYVHDSRGNSCVIKYLTDSVVLNEKKGLLLQNASLPDIKDDLLSKGFIGSFASRQIVSYLLVSYEDLDQYLIKEP